MTTRINCYLNRLSAICMDHDFQSTFPAIFNCIDEFLAGKLWGCLAAIFFQAVNPGIEDFDMISIYPGFGYSST